MPFRVLASVAAAMLLSVGIPACSHPGGEPRPEAAIRLDDSMAAVQLDGP